MKVPERFRGPAAAAEINAMIVTVIGVFLFCSGIADISQLMKDGGSPDWHCIMPVLSSVIGLSLMLFPHSRPQTVVPLAAGVYAVSTIITETEYLISNMTTLRLLLVITSIAIVVSAAQYAIGYGHGTTRIMATLLVHFAVLLPSLFLIFVIMPRFMELTVSSYSAMFGALFLAALVFYLFRPGVRDDSFNRRINLGMRTVASLLSTSSGTFVYSDDVDAITGIDRSGWSPAEGGRILTHSSELTDENRTFDLVSEIWDDDGRIRISVTQRGASQYMATSFVLKGHTIEETEQGRYLRLYGEGGRFMRILVADRPAVGKEMLTDSASDDAIEEAEIEAENELSPV